MNYPLISEYIEAIKSAEDNFEELSYLRPVLGDDGLPVMTSGNFAVVFKVKDMNTGKFYALKCFTKEQEGRAKAYHQITEELLEVDSPYLIGVRYLDKELFVDTDQSEENEFPVLLMDWVEGKTLDKYLRENLDDKYALEMLAYRFSQLAQWLISQPFAHGDLKPDNVLVREDGTMVLVDYDGMYVPAMKGQKARELGSPDFRHPLRTEDDFDEHIDDFPIIILLLTYKYLSVEKGQLNEADVFDGVLFHESDYLNILDSKSIQSVLCFINDPEIARLYAALLTILAEKEMDYSLSSFLFKDNCQAQAFNEIKQKALWDKGGKFCLSCCLRNGFGCEKDTKHGIEILRELANEGDDKAQNQLGLCYDYGMGIKQDFAEAVLWYSKAADQGNPSAQLNLGISYHNGDGVAKDEEKAFDYFKKAAQRNNAMADYYLGDCYLNGDGIQRNEDEAFKYYLKAAEKGNPLAQSWLIDCSAYGYEPHEYEKAVKWYRKTAELGDALAQYWLGTQYDYSFHREANYEEAAKWYKKAANQSYPLAQRRLAECFENGEGVLKSVEKAVEWYFKAAEQGDSYSQYKIGDFYYYGDVVPQSDTKAVEWYKKSAAQGYSEAEYSLGDCYYYGIGVSQSYRKAVAWYIKASEKGNKDSLFKLGVCYEKGRGIKQSSRKAFECYMKSALKGNSDSQYNLGDCYYFGRGVEQSYEKAIEYYTNAAEQSDSDAQNNIGVCYECGLGVPLNGQKATEWYTKAAEKGSIYAMKNLGYCYYYGIGVPSNIEKAVQLYKEAIRKENMDAILSIDDAIYNISEKDAKNAERFYSTYDKGSKRLLSSKDII